MADMKWLRRDCHPLALYFGLCLTDAAFKQELKRLKVGDVEFIKNWHSSATTQFFENRKEKNICAIVCMHPIPDKPIELVYAILVHEAVHIWRYNCELIGEDRPSAEFECYGIQHISSQLMAAYRDMTKKRGNRR